MTTTFETSTRAGAQVRVCRLEGAHSLSDLPEALGLPAPAPAVVLVGGAGSLDSKARERLRSLFLQGLAVAVEHAGAALIDGGTDAGVMRLAGEARAQLRAQFALVGVAAVGTVELPGADAPAPSAAPLEPHHTHLVLVPGDQFGDESPWIADVASEIAGGLPSVTVLVGGGAIAWEDVENSVAVGRPVIVVDGSGGTADALARGLESAHHVGRVERLAATGRFHVVQAADGPRALREAIVEALSELHALPPSASRGRRAERGAGDEEAALVETIAELPLPEPKRRFLEGRWLGQIRWMEGKAARCQRDYYWSRRIIIVCSALVPVLTTSTMAFPARGEGVASLVMRCLSIVLSVLVTMAAAWEEFFRNGERWRHYRQTVEQLKSEGWLFCERSGPYAEYPSHARAHAAFVLRVEQVLAGDVQGFIGEIAAEKKAGPWKTAPSTKEEAKAGEEAP